MLSKNLEKFVRSLHQLKNRRRENLFFVEGHKMAADLLDEENGGIRHILALQEWVDKQNISNVLTQKITIVSEKSMQKISALKTATEVMIIAEKPDLVSEVKALENGIAAIFLEGIQNPGNMGTILRIADWFGIPQVIASLECVDFYNPKVIQASMSSIFRLQLSVMDLDSLAQKKGVAELWATDMNGESIKNIKKNKKPIILMIGNEGKGLSSKAKQLAEVVVTIPGDPKSKTESLNAAVACGIICSWF